jgi:hypothetical protein
MKAKRREKRSKLKPFVKVVNYNHIMPTRYSLDVTFDKDLVVKSRLKDAVSDETKIKENNRKKKKKKDGWMDGWMDAVLVFLPILCSASLLLTFANLSSFLSFLFSFSFSFLLLLLCAQQASKMKVRKEIKAKLEERFKGGQNPWFFQKLRF